MFLLSSLADDALVVSGCTAIGVGLGLDSVLALFVYVWLQLILTTTSTNRDTQRIQLGNLVPLVLSFQ